MVSGCSPLGSGSGGSFVLWKGDPGTTLHVVRRDNVIRREAEQRSVRTPARSCKGLMHRRLVLVGSAEDDCCLMGQPRSEGIM